MAYTRRMSQEYADEVTFLSKEPGNLREALKLAVYLSLPGDHWHSKSLAANAMFRGMFGAQNTTTAVRFPLNTCENDLAAVTPASIAEIDQILSILHLPSYANLSPRSQTVWRIGMRQWTNPTGGYPRHVDGLLEVVGDKVASKIGVMIGMLDHGMNRSEMTHYGQDLGRHNAMAVGCVHLSLRGTAICDRFARSKSFNICLRVFYTILTELDNRHWYQCL